MEEWKQLSRIPSYEVSSDGKVRSTKNDKQRMLKICENNHGYELVCLSHKGKTYTSYVHRLVAEVFIPTSNMALSVNHKDKNRKNNSVDNLEWVTEMENVWHRDDQEKYNKASELFELCRSMSVSQIEELIEAGRRVVVR